jgi:lipopolysaccharide transport system permease protein
LLFAVLIIFNLFAEVVNRSPNLILEHPNLVKKVVFPLEILPIVATGSAVFHAAVSLTVLLLFELAVRRSVPMTAFYLPLILAPFLLLTLGISWLLASIGVYIRDVAQTVGILTTAMMFISPIFFPLSALPERMRPFLQLNPLALIVEQARAVLVFGTAPAWAALAGYGVLSILGGAFGLWGFHKLRRGFADVL